MGSRLEKGSQAVRKRIESHSFENEEGDEYEGSKFGGFADYFRRKKLKLQNLDVEVRSQSAGNPQIFRGIVAHVNGYTQPSLNDLHHLIVSHGGGFMQYLDGKTTVTHIIAANLTPKKAVEFRRYRIVKPAWIVDSIAAGKLLPWDSYRVVDEGSGQRLLAFNEGRMVSQANTQQGGYRDQTNMSWYTSQVKDIAGDIDGGNGAQFLGTRSISPNGAREYQDHSVDWPIEDVEDAEPEGHEVDKYQPQSSGNFEVTSSLEDALNNIQCKEGSGEQEKMPMSEPASPNFISAPPYQRKRSAEIPNPSPSKKAKVMSPEEHNALLLADPHIRKSSTGNPEFIKQYYSESRLHHLSIWKAELKAKLQQMAAEKTASQPKQNTKKAPGTRRFIMHVDFDSFFCAVSLKSAPEYIDKPAVVAHGSGTGSEIASCNYPARAFGVKNGMWMKSALNLCPDIKVLPYDFPAYEEASQRFYEAILDVGGIVQSVSVDEALVDITDLCLHVAGADVSSEGGTLPNQERADSIALDLRNRIKERTGCAVSIGIGSCILLAKVALRRAKPAGQYQIKPEDVMDFIGELSVRDLPGVAHSIGGKLEEIGVTLVKDIRLLSKERLITILGPKTGEKIWDYSRGIDRTKVGETVVRKSVSAEVNWGIRFISQPEAEEFVQNLCIELQRRLIDQGVKGKQLTMKIMKKSADAPLDPPKHLGHGKCDTFNKSIGLGVSTNSADVIGCEAVSILRSYGFSPGELRGLGVQMTKLVPLKAPGNPMQESSQRRINFDISAAPKVDKRDVEDPIDDPQTPKKPKSAPGRARVDFNKELDDPVDEPDTVQNPRSFAMRLLENEDPIEISPQKPKATPVHPAAAIARANAADRSATKVLNVTGTQFIIPSQVDPTVLAELPQDIRSKLMAQRKSRLVSRERSPVAKSRSHSPGAGSPLALPLQLDPEVFEALPDDMKAEVLDSYTKNTGGASRGQNLLLPSPRKARSIIPPKKTTPTKKRGRGRPAGALNRANRPDAHSNLMQSSFITNIGDTLGKPADYGGESDNSLSDYLDPEFLSALPDDMREEIVKDHGRKRLAKKGGLETAAPAKKRKPPDVLPGDQLKLRLPPREPRPTFTTQELSTLPELRDTLSTWYREFADDGPHPDDVAAMERYLRRVILDERDMAKVVSVVRWLQWLIDESDEKNEGTKAWAKALGSIKDKAQSAVQERGLGRMEL